MPLYVFLHTGVLLINAVPMTTQDEDKSGKAMLYTLKEVLFADWLIATKFFIIFKPLFLLVFVVPFVVII